MALTLPTWFARADHNDMAKDMQSPKDSKEFAMKAAEGGMMEVQLSQLAQEKAQSSQVKELAQRMVQDHQKANQQLMEVCKQKGINLSTDLDSHQKDMLQAFKQLNGKDFDCAYVLFNIKDHLKDMMMYEKEAQSGTDQEIKQFATQTVPILREHAMLTGRTAMALGIPVDALTGGSGTATGTRTETAQPAGSRQEPNTGK
jgi:putative membrane protein